VVAGVRPIVCVFEQQPVESFNVLGPVAALDFHARFLRLP